MWKISYTQASFTKGKVRSKSFKCVVVVAVSTVVILFPYMHVCITFLCLYFGLRTPCDGIAFGPRSTQVMAWCLMAPSHYLNQSWLLISEVLWHSPEDNFTGMFTISILDISLKITNLGLQPHHPWYNELNKRKVHTISFVARCQRNSELIFLTTKYNWGCYSGHPENKRHDLRTNMIQTKTMQA